MGVTVRTCWLILLLSVANLAAASGDLRLVDAVRTGDAAAVRALLAQRIDVNVRQGDGTTALAWAVLRDDGDTAGLLLRAGADVNAANIYGVTPLLLACANHNAAMVDRLLQAGANPKSAQWSGETPLMRCARTGSVEAVKSLLARGADVNAATRRGQTALMWAAAQRRPDVVQALVASGANVNATSRALDGFTPAQYFTYGLAENFDYEPLGAVHRDPEAQLGGFTPLMFAARVGDLRSAQILLDAGAKINHATPDYGNALEVASVNGHEALAISLVERGVDLDVVDRWGFTPLHYALRAGITAVSMPRSPTLPTDPQWLRPNMPALVKALLTHGANPNARVGQGFPPYNYLPFGRLDNRDLPYLRSNGAAPFLLAAAAGDVGSMRVLVTAGADPLLATEDGATPLMVAAGLGKLWPLTPEEEARALEALTLTVELGGDVNAAIKDGRTALMGAAHIGANRLVQFLAERGANLDAQDAGGQTALGVALNARPPGVAGRATVRTGRNFRQSAGQTGAEMPPHEDTAALLVKLGATPLPRPTGARQSR
jgi:ankyrin repeat protein